MPFFITETSVWTEKQAREAPARSLSKPALRVMGFQRVKPGHWRDSSGIPVGKDRMFPDSLPHDLDIATDPRASTMAREWLREETGQEVTVAGRGDEYAAIWGDIAACGTDEHEATARLIIVLAGRDNTPVPLPAERDGG